ncbi:hypothetical protein BH23ACT7_BH23ACT7_02290 [soil metagenome]
MEEIDWPTVLATAAVQALVLALLLLFLELGPIRRGNRRIREEQDRRDRALAAEELKLEAVRELRSDVRRTRRLLWELGTRTQGASGSFHVQVEILRFALQAAAEDAKGLDLEEAGDVITNAKATLFDSPAQAPYLLPMTHRATEHLDRATQLLQEAHRRVLEGR